MDLAILSQLENSTHGFYLTRYFTIAGLTVLLWDYCLTFEQERRYMWFAPRSIGKFGFFCCRYIVPVILFIEAYTNSGLSTTTFSVSFCRTWVVITCLCGVTFSAFSRALLLLKLWNLWNGAKAVILGTSMVFVIAEVGTVVFMAISIYQSWGQYNFVPFLHICAVHAKPDALKGVWAFTVFLELFFFIMVYLNALSRPRGPHAHLAAVLYRDEIVFFLVISVLGWMNLLVAIKAPASHLFIGAYCIWALITAVVSRMVMNLQEAEEKSAKYWEDYYAQSDTWARDPCILKPGCSSSCLRY